MTGYELGFLNECAGRGVSAASAIWLLKAAQTPVVVQSPVQTVQPYVNGSLQAKRPPSRQQQRPPAYDQSRQTAAYVGAMKPTRGIYG